MRVLAISGSLRQGSYNTALLRAAAGAVPAGVTVDFYDTLSALPPYDEDADDGDGPPAVADLRAHIHGAEAILIATPEYNGSIPGLLKNALDWASRPFPDNVLRGKPVAILGASSGMFGATAAQVELRRVLGLIGARTLDRQLALAHAQDEFDADGRLRDARLDHELREVLHALAREACADGVRAA